jgi:NADPH2:quinone reductase
MKALVCHEYGPLRNLKLEEIASPPLQAGSVRIALRVASVNPPDVLMPQGKYQVKPAVPFVPGVEGMGRVSEIGEGVLGLQVGDRVMTYAGWGCFADEVVVPAHRVHPVPERMDDTVAAGFILVYSTAYHAIVDCGRVAPGEEVVVLGASGGIGLCAIQIAKALGARVIAVASSTEKLAKCRDHGADELINGREEDLTAAIRSATGGRGADVILDVIGGDVTEAALRAIAPYGRHLIAGYATGVIPMIKGNLVLLKQAQVIGVSYRLLLERTPERAMANLAALCRLYEAGKLSPEVTGDYVFDNVVDAIELVGAGRAIGKVCVRIR